MGAPDAAVRAHAQVRVHHAAQRSPLRGALVGRFMRSRADHLARKAAGIAVHQEPVHACPQPAPQARQKIGRPSNRLLAGLATPGHTGAATLETVLSVRGRPKVYFGSESNSNN